jgi:hypothetical protein
VLVVDVGTNAEILLGNSERVLACSSPTGPAFEGAQISAGQRAAPGAIERVEIDPVTKEPRFRVIGCDLWSDEPGFAEAVGGSGITGICGSGIIEAVAEMRMAGLVDAAGLIGSAADRLRALVPEGTHHAYLLTWQRRGRAAHRVTQGDIRAIQLAKSALYAGARLLMDEIGTDTVDRVVLAGAFGAHISPKHAMVLGMIPDCPLEKVTSAGNAAGTGARIALCNAAARREIERWCARSQGRDGHRAAVPGAFRGRQRPAPCVASLVCRRLAMLFSGSPFSISPAISASAAVRPQSSNCRWIASASPVISIRLFCRQRSPSCRARSRSTRIAAVSRSMLANFGTIRMATTTRANRIVFSARSIAISAGGGRLGSTIRSSAMKAAARTGAIARSARALSTGAMAVSSVSQHYVRGAADRGNPTWVRSRGKTRRSG